MSHCYEYGLYIIYPSNHRLAAIRNLHRIRILHAEASVTNRNILGDAVEVIAMNCELNTNSFYRLFKKNYGMSPTEYRRLGKECHSFIRADTRLPLRPSNRK